MKQMFFFRIVRIILFYCSKCNFGSKCESQTDTQTRTLTQIGLSISIWEFLGYLFFLLMPPPLLLLLHRWGFRKPMFQMCSISLFFLSLFPFIFPFVVTRSHLNLSSNAGMTIRQNKCESSMLSLILCLFRLLSFSQLISFYSLNLICMTEFCVMVNSEYKSRPVPNIYAHTSS